MHCNNCVDSILEYDQIVPLKDIAQVKMYNMMVLWLQKVIQKTVGQEDRKTALNQLLSVYDDISMHIVLLLTYYFTYKGKWACLHCLVAMSFVNYNI